MCAFGIGHMCPESNLLSIICSFSWCHHAWGLATAWDFSYADQDKKITNKYGVLISYSGPFWCRIWLNIWLLKDLNTRTCHVLGVPGIHRHCQLACAAPTYISLTQIFILHAVQMRTWDNIVTVILRNW